MTIKVSKQISYHKSGWLQPLLCHNLTGGNFCILKGECRKSQSVNDPFRKLSIILENSAEIRSCHCTCVVSTDLTNPSCTSSTNEWLPCRKDIEPTNTKGLNFDRKDFAQ